MYDDDDDDDSRLACAFSPSIIDRTCPSDCESAMVDRERDDDEVAVLLLSLFLVVATASAAEGTIVAVVDATASLVEGREDPASAYAGLLGEDDMIMDETVADSIPCRSARRSPFVVGGGVVVVAIFIVAAVVIVVGEYCLYDEAEIDVGVAIRSLLSATRN